METLEKGTAHDTVVVIGECEPKSVEPGESRGRRGSLVVTGTT